MSLCVLTKLILWIVSTAVMTAGYFSCSKHMVWEKVKGMKPESPIVVHYLYRGIESQGIVSACFEKCKALDCDAFIINLEKSYCFSVDWKGNQFVPEPNNTFYHKVCLNVPKSCLARNWQVERSLGAVLLDSMAVKVMPEITSRSECYEACINKGASCRAAQFQTSRHLYIDDTAGTCSLLSIGREMKPQAYRVSIYGDEYLENQCHDISKADFCSYAEYRDMLMPHSDLKLTDLDTKQCQRRCDESNDGFLCRGFGIDRTTSNRTYCYLYSEDTISSGVSSLVAAPNSSYRELEPCIDMSVHCTSSSLIVELRTKEPFKGRIYASGFSDNCSVQGLGDNVTLLVLPLPHFKSNSGNETFAACGLTLSPSSGQGNQAGLAMVWSTVIVQFNPIIQRLGDQAVRVGCSFLNGTTIPIPQNISVNSGFTFIDPNAGLPPIVSTVVNTSSVVPTVSMHILDKSLKPANVTRVGQKLILKIQMSPNEGPFDITAGLLVASSYNGDVSLLLLDELGCPTDPKLFPPLGRDPTDNRSLVAEFSAFKFPASQHVRFNVIVKFCLDTCKPAHCSSANRPASRHRRSIATDRASVEQKKNELEEQNRSSLDNGATTTRDQLPLQTTIIVQESRSSGQDIVPNPFKHNPDTFVIVDPDRMDSQFCMDAYLILFFMMILLVIQIILIASCIFAIRNYRRLAIRAEEDRADILARHLYSIHGGNFEISRRVRWLDDDSLPS